VRYAKNPTRRQPSTQIKVYAAGKPKYVPASNYVCDGVESMSRQR